MDRFDNIWKERLKEPESPALDWCTPSNQVWNGVAEELFPKTDRRVLVWWWFGAGLLTLSVALFLYFVTMYTTFSFNSPVVKTKNELIEPNSVTRSEPLVEKGNRQESLSSTNSSETKSVAELYDLKKSEKEFEQTKSAEPKVEPVLKSAVAGEPKQHTSTFQSNVIERNASTTFFSQTETSVEPAAQSLVKQSPIFKEENDILNTQTSIETVEERFAATSKVRNESKPYSSPKVLQGLPRLVVNQLNNKPSFDLLPFVQTPVEPSSDNGFSLRLSSGLFIWQHEISKAYSNDLSAFDFNYIDNEGFFVRADLRKKISPFLAFAIGAELDRVKIESGHNSTLDYLITEEEAGTKENSYGIDLATPYGLMPAQFKFSRDSDLMEDVSLLVDFENVHIINNIRVPVAFTFTPLHRWERWQLGLDAGVGFNYITNLRNRAQAIVTNHDQIHLQESSVVLADQDFKKFHVDLFGAVFLERQIKRDWALRAFYEYSMGQSKLFELGAYHTKINRQYFGVGLSKLFN